MNRQGMIGLYLTMRYIFFLLLLFTSCDCVYQTAGQVTDAQTGAPLDSVTYHMDQANVPGITDSTGKFDVHEITGFNCGCKGVVFERAGYKSATIRINNMDTVIVKMEKVK